MAPITSSDEAYATIYAFWLREGRPAMFLLQGMGYQAVTDNEVLTFYEVPRAQLVESKRRTGADAKAYARWAGIYGYQPEE